MHCTLYSVHCTLSSRQCDILSSECIMCDVQSTMFIHVLSLQCSVAAAKGTNQLLNHLSNLTAILQEGMRKCPSYQEGDVKEKEKRMRMGLRRSSRRGGGEGAPKAIRVLHIHPPSSTQMQTFVKKKHEHWMNTYCLLLLLLIPPPPILTRSPCMGRL